MKNTIEKIGIQFRIFSCSILEQRIKKETQNKKKKTANQEAYRVLHVQKKLNFIKFAKHSK